MASNWDDLERWMEAQQLPRGFEMLKEPDWVEKFIRRMMTKALPEAAGSVVGTTSATITEGKRFIQVRLTLPPGTKRSAVRLLVKENLLRLDGLPDGKVERIKLPKSVKAAYCQAIVKDNVLHIKLQKRLAGTKWREQPVDWL